MSLLSQAETAEIILHGGWIADPPRCQPMQCAVAIAQGRIMAVGTDKQILALAAAHTEIIDLQGRLILPGFIDTHIHFYEWSLRRTDLALDDAVSLDELLKRVGDAAGKAEAGKWIIGQGWNETDWDAPLKPDRDLLDDVCPHHPVLLWRCDLHLAVANSAALDRADIDENTPDPPEGRIERDSNGRPTGILRELAINLVRQAIDEPAIQDVERAFEEATQALYRRGVTTIHDVRLMEDRDGGRALQAFQNLESDNRLGLRCWCTLPGHRLDEIIALGLRSGFGSELLRLGHVKFFSDGGVGARTAWMIDKYEDAEYGMPLVDMQELADQIKKADRAGLSVMVHAVGDRANREVIRIFEEVDNVRGDTGGPPPPRLQMPHRIEHVQVIQPDDIARLAQLPLALCVTPSNMILDMNLIDTALGERGGGAYAFRQLIDSGAQVMFSSDCPVCDSAPLPAIAAAVTRQRQDGSPADGWYPESRISVEEAVAAYTSTPASVQGTAELGSIKAGALADLAIVSSNIFSIPSSEIIEARVDMTIFAGRIVFKNESVVE